VPKTSHQASCYAVCFFIILTRLITRSALQLVTASCQYKRFLIFRGNLLQKLRGECMNNLRTSPISSCKNLPPYFFMVHLLHRLYGVDAPAARYAGVDEVGKSSPRRHERCDDRRSDPGKCPRRANECSCWRRQYQHLT